MNTKNQQHLEVDDKTFLASHAATLERKYLFYQIFQTRPHRRVSAYLWWWNVIMWLSLWSTGRQSVFECGLSFVETHLHLPAAHRWCPPLAWSEIVSLQLANHLRNPVDRRKRNIILMSLCFYNQKENPQAGTSIYKPTRFQCHGQETNLTDDRKFLFFEAFHGKKNYTHYINVPKTEYNFRGGKEQGFPCNH